MPLSAGTQLGPYEVVEPLGAGGMGEAYRRPRTNGKGVFAHLPVLGERGAGVACRKTHLGSCTH